MGEREGFVYKVSWTSSFFYTRTVYDCYSLKNIYLYDCILSKQLTHLKIFELDIETTVNNML